MPISLVAIQELQLHRLAHGIKVPAELGSLFNNNNPYFNHISMP